MVSEDQSVPNEQNIVLNFLELRQWSEQPASFQHPMLYTYHFLNGFVFTFSTTYILVSIWADYIYSDL